MVITKITAAAAAEISKQPRFIRNGVILFVRQQSKFALKNAPAGADAQKTQTPTVAKPIYTV